MTTDIVELKDGMKKVDAAGTIQEIADERTVNLRTGSTARVCNVKLEDSTGSVTLVLWDGDIDKVKKGDVVSIGNGYVSAYRGEMQLNVGRYGKLEIVQ